MIYFLVPREPWQNMYILDGGPGRLVIGAPFEQGRDAYIAPSMQGRTALFFSR